MRVCFGRGAANPLLLWDFVMHDPVLTSSCFPLISKGPFFLPLWLFWEDNSFKSCLPLNVMPALKLFFGIRGSIFRLDWSYLLKSHICLDPAAPSSLWSFSGSLDRAVGGTLCWGLLLFLFLLTVILQSRYSLFLRNVETMVLHRNFIAKLFHIIWGEYFWVLWLEILTPSFHL